MRTGFLLVRFAGVSRGLSGAKARRLDNPRLSLPHRRSVARVASALHDRRGAVRRARIDPAWIGGRGRELLNAGFAGELFGPGQPLDANRYFIILPDALGAGKSSKPSDGLRTRFPKYNYDDTEEIVEASLQELHEGARQAGRNPAEIEVWWA